MFSVILQYDRRNADATSSFRGAGIIEPTQERGLAMQKSREANTARFRILKADRYRRRQRGSGYGCTPADRLYGVGEFS